MTTQGSLALQPPQHVSGCALSAASRVAGDAVYNGTLDDAAYVALLIRVAERRHGTGFRQPLLLAAFTGEEKGLPGARWFVGHPTAPREAIAADIKLDQLWPIFPLRLLTVHALADTTLGDDTRSSE